MAVAEIIGLTVAQMREKYPDIQFRITRVNGSDQLKTSDYVPTRYNLHTQDGIIVHYTMG